MKINPGIRLKKIKLKAFTVSLLIVWTIIIILSLLWSIMYEKENTIRYARESASTTIDNIVIYRKWIASKGGVYVPISETSQPNHYLKIKDRDLSSTSGKSLTLMNPAYVTRQVFDLLNATTLLRGHITSLKPLNPNNTPDHWEIKALREFEKGKKEVYSVETINNEEYFRYMKPLRIEKSCLKCHDIQGYSLEDIKGGISFSIFMKPLLEIQSANSVRILYYHLFIWLIGMGGILLTTSRLKKNIKEREAISEALQKSESQLKAIFDTTGVAIAVLDLNGNCGQTNVKMQEMLGYTTEEITTKSLYSMTYDDDIEATKIEMKKLIANETDIIRLEKRCVRKNNEVFWADISLTPIRNNKSQIIAFISAAVDINTRKLAEEQVRNLKLQIELILNSAGDGIIGINKEGIQTFINPAAAKMLGYEITELLGKDYFYMWHHSPLPGSLGNKSDCRIFNSMLEGKEIHITEDIFWRKDSGYFPVEYRCVPFSKNGSTDGAVITFSDITEHLKTQSELVSLVSEINNAKNQIEDELNKKNELLKKLEQSERKLKEAVSTKDKFFSIIAHDLKNPIGSFKGLISLIVEDYESFTDEELIDILDKIDKSSAGILNLLENLLYWSRSQTGRIEFNPEEVYLRFIGESVISILKPGADNKNISLINEIEEGLFIKADANMLMTIFRNLISNAVKFTYEGGKVKISAVDKGDSLKISVKDTGMGMTKDDLNKLFRIDISNTSIGTGQEKGTGIGLILCKEFVERHQGKIWAESEPGKGSVFHIELPREMKMS